MMELFLAFSVVPVFFFFKFYNFFLFLVCIYLNGANNFTLEYIGPSCILSVKQVFFLGGGKK